MILSLEDEEEADLQDVTQNVITVDDEYLNGPMLGRSQQFLGLLAYMATSGGHFSCPLVMGGCLMGGYWSYSG